MTTDTTPSAPKPRGRKRKEKPIIIPEPIQVDQPPAKQPVGHSPAVLPGFIHPPWFMGFARLIPSRWFKRD